MIDEATVRSVRDRALLLRSLESFKGLSDEDLSILAERMRLRNFEQGDIILAEADPIESVFFIIEGRVRIERNGAHLGTLTRGKAAGLFAVLAGDKHGVHATVEQATVTFELSVHTLMSALKRYPTLLRHFIRVAADILLASQGHFPTQDPPEWRESYSQPDRPLTLAERIMMAHRSIGVMVGANLDAVFEIVCLASEVHVPAGEFLWHRGDPSTASIVIDRGRVRCTAAEGSETVMAPPHVFGRLESLAERPRPYDAVAETDLKVLRIDIEIFLAVLESHPDVGLALISRLASSLMGIGWSGRPASVTEPQSTP
jgi:CRP-like cAMP-binding protein